MKRTIIIILAVLSLLGFLLARHYYTRPFDLSDIWGAIDVLSNFIVLFLFAVVLSPLLALIPVKNTSYLYRLSFTFPISIILMSSLLSWAFYITGLDYSAIKQEENLDCSSVKTGHFKFMDMKIERGLHHQIQTEGETEHPFNYDLEWLGDCEYQLRNGDTIAKVKIVHVDKDGYDCYVEYRGRTSEKLRILRDNDTLR